MLSDARNLFQLVNQHQLDAGKHHPKSLKPCQCHIIYEFTSIHPR